MPQLPNIDPGIQAGAPNPNPDPDMLLSDDVTPGEGDLPNMQDVSYSATPDNPLDRHLPGDLPPQASDTRPAGSGGVSYAEAMKPRQQQSAQPRGGVSYSQAMGQRPAAPQQTEDGALQGTVDIIGTATVGTVVNAAGDLVNKITGYDPPQIHLGTAGQQVLHRLASFLPFSRGLDVSDQELRETLDPSGKIPIDALRSMYQRESQKSTTQLMKESGRPIGKIVGNALEVGGDALALAPVAGFGARAFSSIGEYTAEALAGRAGIRVGPGNIPLWKAQGFTSADQMQAYNVGFRSGVVQSAENIGQENIQLAPGAKNLAPGELRTLLTNNTADVGAVLGHAAAGVAHDEALTIDTIKAARAAPEAVYERAFRAIDAAGAKPLNDADQIAVIQAAQHTSPAVQAELGPLRDELLSHRMSGTYLQGKLSDLRREGFAGLGAEGSAEQAIGRGKLQMADVLERHLDQNLPPYSGTSVEQLHAARKALAQNYTVQEVLRGENELNLPKLGRMYAANPERYGNGPLSIAAKFANANPTVSNARINIGDNALRHMMGKVAAGNTQFHALKPGTWWSGTYGAAVRKLGIPQRTLLRGGGPDVARQLFPDRDPNTFAPLSMGLARPPGTVGRGEQLQLPMRPGRDPALDTQAERLKQLRDPRTIPPRSYPRELSDMDEDY